MTTHLETLRALHHSGDLEQAKKGYLSLLKKNPHHPEVTHLLGILYAQQNNFSEAARYLEIAVKYQPHNPAIALHLANVLKMQGLFSQAVQVLLTLVQTHSDYAAAFNNLGTVYYAQGKFSEACAAYRDAIRLEKNYIDAYYNLGLALSKQDQFDEAIETYQKLLTLAPEHFAAQFHLACLFMRQQNFSDASKHFLLIEENQPYHFETLVNIATCYLKQGALQEAKSYYLKALELTPQDTQILYNLGVINMQQGNLDFAIQYYQRAAAIDPNEFAAHNNLGVAFLAKQHVGFALHHFQEALRLQPNNESIQYIVKMLAQNQRLLAAPPDYVKSLFDNYADHYEAHLLSALDYQLPNALFNAANIEQTSLDILDLGCGTGLCGVPFKSLANSLIGVDLSENMLAIAKQKNIYDQLIASDITAFLTNKTACYDLILAGDVLVYIGDLDVLFSSVTHALRDNGRFVFNTEICADENTPFKMNQSGRFSHHKTYLENLAEKNHLTIVSYQEITTRMQNNEPVWGHVFVLHKKTS